MSTARKVDYILEESLNLHMIVSEIFFFSVMEIFELKIVSDSTWHSFNCNLKKLMNEQINIFHSPSNTVCLSDEFVQIKHFKHPTFIGMCSFFTWFNLQILNFC